MGRYSAINQFRLPFLHTSWRKEGVEDINNVMTTGDAEADASASNIYSTTKAAVDAANANVISAAKSATDKASADVLAATQTASANVLTAIQVASAQASADVLNATKKAVEQAARDQAVGDLVDKNTIQRQFYLIVLLVLVLMSGGWYTYSLRRACNVNNPSSQVEGVKVL